MMRQDAGHDGTLRNYRPGELMTPEEFDERRKRLGASDVASVLGISPWRSAWQVWAEKTGRLEQWHGNAATKAGQRLESAILDHAEEDLGVQLFRNVVVKTDGPLSATLDAQDRTQNVPVEAKTSGIVGPVHGRWGDIDTDEVPEVYLVQLCVQMLCTEAEMAYLYALLGGRGIIRYRVMRDDSTVNAIRDAAVDWWERHVVGGVEPARTTPVPLDVVKRLRREPNKVIEFDDTTTRLVAAWEAAKEMKRVSEKGVDDMQSQILLRLGDAEAARMSDGRMFTYMEQPRKGYTVADGTMRVARVRKA